MSHPGAPPCKHLAHVSGPTTAPVVQVQRQVQGIARSAPRAAAVLVQRAFLQPCSTGQQGKLANPTSRGQALMEALSNADNPQVASGLLAAAARRHGLAEIVSSALAQV